MLCNVDGARAYYAKQNKSVRERQITCDFAHMQNLRNKTNNQREKKRERQIKKQTLDSREQADGQQRKGG